jgi:hypothetical protein
VLNDLEARLIFLEFCNAYNLGGKQSRDEWRGATKMIHALLGVPADLRRCTMPIWTYGSCQGALHQESSCPMRHIFHEQEEDDERAAGSC